MTTAVTGQWWPRGTLLSTKHRHRKY